jgi:D-psicose/D-tagatose/L-ribulose 3-epimerase
VTIGIEPVNRYETNMVNRHDQAIALVEAVGPGAGVILDAFHMAIEESDICAAIQAMGPVLVEVQFADSNRLPPGKGRLDWGAILRTLVDICFTSFLTAEMQSPEDRMSAAWSRRADPAALPAESEAAEAPFLKPADGFPLSDSDYAATLHDAAVYLRRHLVEIAGVGRAPAQIGGT